MNFLRHACIAVYRVSALALLLIVAAELARANQLLFAIGSMLFKAIGGGIS
jgi:hypothetical protein